MTRFALNEVPNVAMMYYVTRQIDFCYGHRLLNYEGKCRHLHGHNGRAVIKIASSELDHRGMVLDFSDIKLVVSKWIDENLDHRMILHREDPAVEFLENSTSRLFLIDSNPTAENIAKLIYEVTAGRRFSRSRGRPLGNSAVFCHLWSAVIHRW